MNKTWAVQSVFLDSPCFPNSLDFWLALIERSVTEFRLERIAAAMNVCRGRWSTNRPVHYHPDLLAALQPQLLPFSRHIPAHWSRNPQRSVEQLQLPIRILALPTYASWTNPIEKLWRLLKQEVLRLHRCGDNWPGLKQRVFAFLDEFRSGSQDLLVCMGLQDPFRLYQALFPA